MNTMLKNTAIFSLGLSAAFAMGCSTMKKEEVSQPVTPSTETVQAAADSQASNVAEIQFDKNSYTLSESARESLTKTVSDARKNGSIEGIKVVAWADQEYPSAQVKKLSKHDYDLAEKRADSIKNFIKTSLNQSGVQTYNMAKRPNSLSKLFNTTDTRIKTAMESAGIPQTNSATDSITGKASHAVIMIIMK
jgi:hypothetical protein